MQHRKTSKLYHSVKMSHCALNTCHRLKSQLICVQYRENRATSPSWGPGIANTWPISNLLSTTKGACRLKLRASLQLQGVQGVFPPETNNNNNSKKNKAMIVSTMH